MADRTGISWADATVNFWWGCTRVSPGCVNCYAETLAARMMVGEPRRHAGWGPHGERVPILGAHALAYQLNARALREKRRLRVFTNSMSDFFDPASLYRGVAWETIRTCTALDWLILTKRPELIRVPEDWGEGWPHVWLGVSVEDQQRAAERLSVLDQIPAAVRFVSCEPLLGPIALDLSRKADGRAVADWLIVGGESGPGRRPMELRWLTDIVAQCQAAGVPCFVKQDSAARPGRQGRIPDDVWALKQFPTAPPSP